MRWFVVVRVRRVIVRDDLCGRSDPRSGCCHLVDLFRPASATPGLPPVRGRCRTARPELSPYKRRQCTSDSSLPRKVKVPGRIRIHLRIVQVHASSAATRLQRGGAIRPISGCPERRGIGRLPESAPGRAANRTPSASRRCCSRDVLLPRNVGDLRWHVWLNRMRSL